MFQMSEKETFKMPIQFSSFGSSVHPGFWSSLSKLKLEVSKLSDAPVGVRGFYVNNTAKGVPACLQVEWDSLDLSTSKAEEGLSWNMFPSSGQILNFNTLEDFKKFNKTEYLDSIEGTRLWSAIKDGDALKNPALLSRFVIMMFADIKKYDYYYWFAFPGLSLPEELVFETNPKKLSDIYPEDIVHALTKSFMDWKSHHKLSSGFFSIKIVGKEVIVNTLEAFFEDYESSTDEVFVGFADPCSSPDYVGWPLRNLLAFLCAKMSKKFFSSTGLNVIALRQNTHKKLHDDDCPVSVSESLLVKVKLDSKMSPSEDPLITVQPKCLGFEKNGNGAFGPKLASMKAQMDPTALAESQSMLNLKLMKWRLVPDLDLEIFTEKKCLLLGSGTLGCSVARCLLGWGFKNISFVDNSKVSFSNPVRQSLYKFSDCLDGGRWKSEAAAAALKEIFPGVKTESFNLTIPLPAHPISDGLLKKTKKDYDLLENLIKSNDIIFLLTDTRESRWLPTVMAFHYRKLVINAALGFDTYLVMRQSIRSDDTRLAFENNLVPGDQLGCYFCTDVVAPGNSTKDRTLDQQCTVTRAGVAQIAAALAVELAVSVLQHPDTLAAAAAMGSTSKASEGVLGIVPHTIRGSLRNFQQFLPTTPKFSSCTGCSKPVLTEFATKGFDMFSNAANDSKFLENLAGISQLMDDVQIDNIIECDDDDDF